LKLAFAKNISEARGLVRVGVMEMDLQNRVALFMLAPNSDRLIVASNSYLTASQQPSGRIMMSSNIPRKRRNHENNLSQASHSTGGTAMRSRIINAVIRRS